MTLIKGIARDAVPFSICRLDAECNSLGCGISIRDGNFNTYAILGAHDNSIVWFARISLRE